MTSPTTIKTNKPPATPKCGLNQTAICRVKSETPQLRAAWVVQAPFGFAVTPAKNTRRVGMCVKNST